MKRFVVVASAAVIVLAMVSFVTAWGAPCPCDSSYLKLKAGGGPKPVLGAVPVKPSPIRRPVRKFPAMVPSAFAQPVARPESVFVYRDRFHEVVRETPRRETWWQRNDQWLIPVAGIVGGVVGWNLRGHDGDQWITVVAAGGDGGDGGPSGDCDPHHPRGKHRGWQGHK